MLPSSVCKLNFVHPGANCDISAELKLFLYSVVTAHYHHTSDLGPLGQPHQPQGIAKVDSNAQLFRRSGQANTSFEDHRHVSHAMCLNAP
jgi:hypothetical protein